MMKQARIVIRKGCGRQLVERPLPSLDIWLLADSATPEKKKNKLINFCGSSLARSLIISRKVCPAEKGLGNF